MSKLDNLGQRRFTQNHTKPTANLTRWRKPGSQTSLQQAVMHLLNQETGRGRG